MVEVEGDPIYVVVGKWNRSTSGEWEFSIDYGKFITLRSDDSVQAYKSRVVKEFTGNCDRTCRLTYWAPAKVSSLSPSKMSPICIGSEDGLDTFKVVRKRNDRVSLYVEFEKVVEEGVNVMLNSGMTKEDRGNSKDIPPKLSQTGEHGTFQQLLLSQAGGSGFRSNLGSVAGTNSCSVRIKTGLPSKGNTAQVNYCEDKTVAAALDDVEHGEIQTSDAILKETQTFESFGCDGDDSEDALCLNCRFGDFGELLPSESERSSSRSYDYDSYESRSRGEDEDEIEETVVETPLGDCDSLDATQCTQMINRAYDDVAEPVTETSSGIEQPPILLFSSGGK